MGDIADQVKAVLDKYTDTVKTISTNLVASNDYRQVVRDLDGIDEDLQKVMSMFKQVVGRNVDYERYNDEKFGSIVQIYRERLTESVGRLNKLISQFNKKYGTGPDED
jgi:Zn-dependent oligopeptidase